MLLGISHFQIPEFYKYPNFTRFTIIYQYPKLTDSPLLQSIFFYKYSKFTNTQLLQNPFFLQIPIFDKVQFLTNTLIWQSSIAQFLKGTLTITNIWQNPYVYRCYSIMDLQTADAIIAHHNNLRSWPQAFKFATSHGLVDLSVSIGNNASTSTNVSMYQPSVYPSWRCHRPVYRFDPNCYSGAEAEKKLVYDVRRSLLGVNFFANNSYDTNFHRTVRLMCSFSKTLKKKHSIRTNASWKWIVKWNQLKNVVTPPLIGSIISNWKGRRRKKYCEQ